MKFAHFSDIHIGAWREPALRDASTRAFSKAIDLCIQQQMDFILISGDFFNTALPSVDLLKQVVTKLKELNDKDIPVYLIPGSHDYTFSGKTMLDVLEEAGLVKNVVLGQGDKLGTLQLTFTTDPKTGAKITGLLGKKGGLERGYFESLDNSNLEHESGYKIFLFHTGIEELKPADLEQMQATPLSCFPKGFDYYAGGHVHDRIEGSFDQYNIIRYPGPLFPCNIRELEKLQVGGFIIVENGIPRFQPIPIFTVAAIKINANGKTPNEVSEEVTARSMEHELYNTVVIVRIEGKLVDGTPMDIPFAQLFREIKQRGAVAVLKNIVKLTSPAFEEIQVAQQSVEEIEASVIKEHLGQVPLPKQMPAEQELTKQLMQILNSEKLDGETVTVFEERIIQSVRQVVFPKQL